MTCATEKCRQLRILVVLALYDVRKFRKRGRKKWKRNKILLFSSECAVEARKQEPAYYQISHMKKRTRLNMQRRKKGMHTGKS